jgi:hypothetical protein
MEKWVLGKWACEILVKWSTGQIVKNHLAIQRFNNLTKPDRIPLEINIPIFHHSIIPCMMRANQASANCFIYSIFQNLRDVIHA